MNRSRAIAKDNGDGAHFKIEISAKVTDDWFEKKKQVKQKLEEATSKAESLHCEMLDANKTNILLTQKMDDYDLATRRFRETLTKKTNQIKYQAEVENL